MIRRHHILSLTVLISIVSLIMPLAASAATNGVLTYTDDGTTVTITGCDDACPATLTIPTTIGGHPVTSIGSSAFQGAPNLTTVTTPTPNELTATVSGDLIDSGILYIDLTDSSIRYIVFT